MHNQSHFSVNGTRDRNGTQESRDVRVSIHELAHRHLRLMKAEWDVTMAEALERIISEHRDLRSRRLGT